MANTLQKKIKFSKGQVSPELIERTDLSFYDSSAQEMKNVVSTIYGGVRTRRGTEYCSKVYGSAGVTGTVLSSMGGTSTAIQNIGDTYTTSNIGSNTELFKIDYGSVLQDANVVVSKIKMDDQHYFATGNQTFTILEKGNYRLRMCGGGGGAGGGTYGSGHKTAGGNGGSGAIFDGVVELEPGSYTISVGSGGSGGVNGNAVGANGSDGESTTLKRDSDDRILISCGGGRGGAGRASGTSSSGSGGSLEYSATVVERYTVSNGLSENTSGWFGTGAGAGGAGVYKGWGESGSTGYAQIGTAFEKIKFFVSDDDNTWTEVQTSNIGESAVDIFVNGNDFRYLKVEIVPNTSFSDITGTMSLNFVRVSMPVSSDAIKMIPFVYNNEQAYVIILAVGKISVYYNGNLIQEITASSLLEQYIKDIKYAFKDDTIILTHPLLVPQQLQRQSDGTWVLSSFTIKNTPYYLFGTETTAAKTVGITPSALEGSLKITADSSIFDSSWVGQYIDGNGGRVRITEYTSGTVVKGVTVIPFYTTDKITSWDYISGYEPVWSVTRGYPSTCLFAQQRLWFGGSYSLPSHIWASRLDDYNNFKNSGNYDNDAIDVTMLTNNRIMSMVEQRGIHVFTSGDEWTIKEDSYTPNAISITKNTENGSYPVEPSIIGGCVCFVEKNGKSLLSYAYDYDQASFMTENISLFSNLIDKPVVFDAEINSSKDKGDFIYVVLEDGTMLCGCILLDQKIISLSKFVTEGKVKDLCCLPDETYLIVSRGGINFLERISEDKTDMTQAGYVDGDAIPNMEMYEGYHIAVYDDTDCEFIYVDGDEINLSKEYHKTMKVGILFDYKLESNPIAVNGKTTSIKKRISKATLTCKDTNVLEFNGQKKKSKDGIFDFYSCTKYDNDVRFIVQGEFYPIEILSVTLNINYEG